jgi:SEC-C motif-containing protein
VHHGEIVAPTAERLMRSRYTAFALGNASYLLESWHSSTRPSSLRLDPEQRWFGLEILRTERGRMLDTIGEVEFRARYRHRGQVGEQHERSRFVRESRRWYYLDDAADGAGSVA